MNRLSLKSSFSSSHSTQSPIRMQQLLHLLCWFALLSVPAQALAMECETDQDCAEGEYCEIYEVGNTEPCFIDEEGNEECGESMVETESVGFCEERPISCVEDSDCPSHLSCGYGQESGSSEGSAPQDTTGFAEDPGAPENPEADIPEEQDRIAEPMEEELMCVFVPQACEADQDCALNFHCEVFSVGVSCGSPTVVVTDCPDDEDCSSMQVEEVECEEEEFTEGFCAPNEIECDSDSACPSDWRCHEIVTSDCGGSDDIAIGAPEPAPSPDSESANTDEAQVPYMIEPEQNDRIECEEITRSLCVPVGFDGIQGSSSGFIDRESSEISQSGPSDLDQEESEETEEGSSNAEVEEGGCDAQSSNSKTTLLLFTLLACLGLRRRFA